MRRREFIAFLSGSAAVWPDLLCAQQPAMPVVGFLSGTSLNNIQHLNAAFHKGLTDAGFIEGKNVAVEYRSAEGRYDRLGALAAELVNRNVAVIVAFGPPSALAAKAATKTIPIVFTSGGDVVKSGLVASLNRPGGNATGINLFTQAVEAKKLEILTKLLTPTASIGFLVNPANPAADGRKKEMQDAARTLGREIHVVNATNEREIDAAFDTLVGVKISSLVVASDPFYDDTQRPHIIGQATRNAILTIYGQREYVTDGGLISYGTSLADTYHQAGVYAGSILKGEKPADLPVLQPTRFELLINLKAAKALKLEIPPNLLAIADEVID